MGLLDAMNEHARALRLREEREAAARAAELSQARADLELMRADLTRELRAIDGQHVKCGILSVHFEDDPNSDHLVARITLKRDNGVTSKVAWFKARVCDSFTQSEEHCVEPRVWARVYKSKHHSDFNGDWDVQEKQQYNNGGVQFEAIRPNSMERFTDTLALTLANQWLQ